MSRIPNTVPRAVVWGVPAVAGVALASGIAVIPIVAGASPSLPHRTSAQLLASLANADRTPFSGQIVQTSRLGIPNIPGLSSLTSDKAQGGTSAASVVSLLSGSHYAKVWYAGRTQARLAVTVGSAETDVIRNGRNLWTWDASTKSGSHVTLPADTDQALASPAASLGTPQQLADQALAAVSPTTSVKVDGTARVAKRKAYELVLRPKQSGTTVREVRIAIDSKTSVPLRVQVWATGGDSPALEAAFQSITFRRPDPAAFRFTVPSGGKLRDLGTAGSAKKNLPNAKAQAEHGLSAVRGGAAPFRVLGTGWTSVVALPKGSVPGLSSSTTSSSSGLSGLSLGTPVSGKYGSGRVISTSLVSVLVLNDGRAYAGAVTPQVLERAASR
jgi:hypothetical protein